MSEATSFRVDLRGMISLLGKHLYSTPDVFLRELLQNGVDAITARADGGTIDPSWSIRITSSRAPGELFRCTDDGIGMTLTQAQEVLSTVGKSSKRNDYDLPVRGYLGQFGIGLLSCFMLADKVTVRTRAANSAAVEWVGYSSGVFTATEIADDLPIGTTVEFVPHPDEARLTTAGSLRELSTYYGQYLPVRIEVDSASINTAPIWTDPDRADPDQLEQLSIDLLGQPALTAIPLSVAGTDLAGTAFVLPYAPSPSARQAHRVYLGGMLVSEASDNLLPDWAYFCRCIITTSDVNPTASREQLIDDEALAHVREGLGAALRRWVEHTARSQPEVWARFVDVHHLGLRSVAAHDPALATIVVPWLPFETSAGRMPLGTFAKRWPVVRYVSDLAEFDTVAALAAADEPVLNAGYTYDAALISDLPRIIPGVEVTEVRVLDALAALAAPAPADQVLTSALERKAAAALESVDCDVMVRVFEPSDVMSFVVTDPHLWRRLDTQQITSKPGLWSSMIAAVEQAAPQAPSAAARAATLCLNWSSPAIRHLATADDRLAVDRIIRVLYCQAAVNTHRPLHSAERGLLAAALDDLLSLTSSPEEPTP